MDPKRNDDRYGPVPEGYDPPRVEEVLHASDLEREVQYAGTNGSLIIG
jgi:hypothetical protein